MRQGLGNTGGATPPTSPTPPTGAVGPSGAPVAPGKEGGKSGLRRFLTPSAGLQTAGKVVGKVAMGGGRFLAGSAPIIAGATAVQGYNTPTEVYGKRYGKSVGDPGLYGAFKDVGTRARGVGEDFVNNMLPDVLFGDDVFGNKTPAPVATPGQVPQTSPGDRAGQTPPAGATPDFVRLTGADADAALNSAALGTAAIRNERTGETRSYTPEGLRRLGGGGLRLNRRGRRAHDGSHRRKNKPRASAPAASCKRPAMRATPRDTHGIGLGESVTTSWGP